MEGGFTSGCMIYENGEVRIIRISIFTLLLNKYIRDLKFGTRFRHSKGVRRIVRISRIFAN